jgi:vacuolar protein sorting-associated protein 45
VLQQESQLFEFKQPDSPPLLLILDRRNDPVTPLLNQWTYQAMIHELLGIKNNLVSSPEIAAGNKDFKVSITLFIRIFQKFSPSSK